MTEEREQPAGLSYSYRPSMMSAPREFRLEEEALVWSIGRHSGRMPYDRITRLRMSFRPVTMQLQRFVTEIWSPGTPRLLIASTSWKNMVEQQRHDREYSAFIAELHRRMAAAKSAARFDAGTPVYIFWPGAIVFGLASLGIAALIVRALHAGIYSGAAFIAAFFALFLWQTSAFFKNNRPGRYSPDLPPAHLLPAGD